MLEIKIDASALASHGACIRALKLTTVDGYRKDLPSNDIVYGSAFHVFKEVLSKTKDEYAAMQAAHMHFKSTPFTIKEHAEWLDLGHLTRTCMDYIEFFGKDREKDSFKTFSFADTPMIEKKFKICVYDADDIKVYNCGTIDDIGRYNSLNCIADEKTTRFTNPKMYFKAFALSTQLLNYIWAIKHFAKQYPDSIFGEICKHRVGAFINGVFLSAKKQTEFIRSEVFTFSDEMLNEFEGWLKSKVIDLVLAAKESLPPREGLINGACKGKYDLCPFFGPCSTTDETTCKLVLDAHYEKVPYDPLKFR